MRRHGIAALAFAALAFYGCLRLTDGAVRQDWMSAGPFYALRLALLGTAIAVLFAAIVLCAVRSKSGMAVRRAWLLLLSSALTFFVFEAAFMFVPQSHNVGYTLAARIWRGYYWRKNELGYRDGPHAKVEGKKTVFLVGDSFAAGAGTPDPSKRFGDLLEARRPDLNVLDLGRSGADSVSELHDLKRHPLTPELVILQYYPNDIEGTAQRAGWEQPGFTPYADLGPTLAFLVRNSFLLDFCYWQLPHTDGLAYVHFLERAMKDPELSRRHLAELEEFCTWSKENGVPLVVVVFPILQDLEKSRELTSGVIALFREHDVPVLDVARLVEDLPVGDRTANRQDAHPSAIVHRRVASALAELLSDR